MLVARLLMVVAVILAANIVGLDHAGLAAVERVAGEAFGLGLGAPPKPVDGSPAVVLPPGGGNVSASAAGRGIGSSGVVSLIEDIDVASSGTTGNDASVTSTARVGYVELFAGLIRASDIRVSARASVSGDRGSTSGSATFANIVVAGQAIVNPVVNERIELPGLGYVILNEQLLGGDGRTSASIVVRAIRLVVTSTSAIDVPPGAEIVVAVAAAGVPDVSVSRPAPGGGRPASPALSYAPISTRSPLDLSFNDNGHGNGNNSLRFDNGNGNDNAPPPTATPTARPTSTLTSIKINITVVVVFPSSTPTSRPETGGSRVSR